MLPQRIVALGGVREVDEHLRSPAANVLWHTGHADETQQPRHKHALVHEGQAQCEARAVGERDEGLHRGLLQKARWGGERVVGRGGAVSRARGARGQLGKGGDQGGEDGRVSKRHLAEEWLVNVDEREAPCGEHGAVRPSRA